VWFCLTWYKLFKNPQICDCALSRKKGENSFFRRKKKEKEKEEKERQTWKPESKACTSKNVL